MPLHYPLNPLSSVSSSARSLAIAAVAVLTLASTASAQIWNEAGDAGELPGAAQTTVGAGALTEINGNLASASDADMYCIRVTNTASFLAALQCVAIGGPDIWIFNAAGNGVSANYLCQSGTKFVNGTFANTVGNYYLAVAFRGRQPFAGANAMWLTSNSAQHAPNGPGAGGVVTSWGGTGNIQPLNPYRIVLGGATFCDDATPTMSESWGALKLIYR